MPLFRDVPKPPAWPPPRDRESIAAAWRYARDRDPIGHVAHTIIAMVYLFLMPLTTTPKDVAFIVLAVYALLRSHCTIVACTSLFRDRLGVLLLVWTGWHALTLLWSGDMVDGVTEIRAFRVVVTTLLIWPVLDRLPLLLAAVLAGVLATNLVQLLQLAEVLGFEPDFNNRLEGLMHPIHAGSVCLAALCWHLSAVLRARGWLRLVSAAAMLAAGAGLVLSGSRGPWIAAAVAVPAMLAWNAVRRPEVRKLAAGLAVVGVVALAAMWPIAGDFVTKRWNDAMADIAATREGDFDTNIGVRIALWQASWEMFRAAPLHGVGAGDFGEAVEAAGHADLLGDPFHAHSVYMHELAATGLPGAALAVIVVVFAIVRAFRDRVDTPWSLGTPWVLVGWAIAALFDAYHFNGHMFGLFAFSVAICTPNRPPVAGPGAPAAAEARGRSSP